MLHLIMCNAIAQMLSGAVGSLWAASLQTQRVYAAPDVRCLSTYGTLCRGFYVGLLPCRHRGCMLHLTIVSILNPASTDAEEAREDAVHLRDAPPLLPPSLPSLPPTLSPATASCFVPTSGLRLVDLSASATPQTYSGVSSVLVSFAEVLSP